MGQSEEIRDLVAAKSDEAVTLAKSIWNFAELAYEETRSCAAMVEAIKKEGFKIELGIVVVPAPFPCVSAHVEKSE